MTPSQKHHAAQMAHIRRLNYIAKMAPNLPLTVAQQSGELIVINQARSRIADGKATEEDFADLAVRLMTAAEAALAHLCPGAAEGIFEGVKAHAEMWTRYLHGLPHTAGQLAELDASIALMPQVLELIGQREYKTAMARGALLNMSRRWVLDFEQRLAARKAAL